MAHLKVGGRVDRQVEISELHMAIGLDQDVLGFQISVHHTCASIARRQTLFDQQVKYSALYPL